MDAFAAAVGFVEGQGTIAWGLFGTMLLGYWIMSLKSDRHHRWRRDRTNLSRMPVWRCQRCGAMASYRARRESGICGA